MYGMMGCMVPLEVLAVEGACRDGMMGGVYGLYTYYDPTSLHNYFIFVFFFVFIEICCASMIT